MVNVIRDASGTAHLRLRVDPPVEINDAGTDATEIFIGPHFEGASLWPTPQFPTAVYIYVARRRAMAESAAFDPAQFNLVAWGEIYETLSDAASGLAAST